MNTAAQQKRMDEAARVARATREYQAVGAGFSLGHMPPMGHPQLCNVRQGGTTYPFTPTITAATISFYPGVMNGLVPSNLFDGDANIAFDLDNGINFITLDATTNGQQVTAVEIGVDSSPPDVIETTMGACPTSFSWLLAIVAGTSAGGFTLLYSSVGNVVALPKQVFISPKASPQYGLESYDRWWTWQTWQLVNL